MLRIDNLTAANLARGLHAIPALAPPVYQYGQWDWNVSPTGKAGGGDHTAGVDARFIWGNGNAISAINGQKGTFERSFGGKRFRLGHLPKTLPPMFDSG